MQGCYAFDVDNTLKLGPHPGPIEVSELKKLMDQGQIVGLCGNFVVAIKYWPEWYKVVSFLGGHTPIDNYKPAFLQTLMTGIRMGDPQVTTFTMVGNTRADALAGIVLPSSNDDGYARLAGWRFVKEEQFAAGIR